MAPQHPVLLPSDCVILKRQLHQNHLAVWLKHSLQGPILNASYAPGVGYGP